MYSFILVYQVMKYFGLYIATWEYSSRRCKCTLSLVSKGESWLWCILNGSGLEMKVSLRQPVPVGAFLLLHGGFLISESFFLPFVPPGAIGFTIFFLVEDMAKSLGSVKGVVRFLKHQACWMFPWFGSVPNHSLVGTLTKALFIHTARFNRVLELLQLAYSTLAEIVVPSATVATPLAAMAWAALLQPPSPRLSIGSG